MTFRLSFNPENKLLASFIYMVLALNSSELQAGSNRSAVTISGTITTPTCKINSGAQISVHFNNVDITQIKKGAYNKEIPITISCELNPSPILLTLTAQQGFNPDLINTSIDGLAIKITHNTSTWAPNTSRRSYTNSNNTINAALMITDKTEQLFLKNGIQSKDQNFTASLTISASYD